MAEAKYIDLAYKIDCTPCVHFKPNKHGIRRCERIDDPDFNYQLDFFDHCPKGIKKKKLRRGEY